MKGKKILKHINDMLISLCFQESEKRKRAKKQSRYINEMLQSEISFSMVRWTYPKIEANIGVRNVSELSFVRLPGINNRSGGKILVTSISYGKSKKKPRTFRYSYSFELGNIGEDQTELHYGVTEITFSCTIEVYTITDSTSKKRCIEERQNIICCKLLKIPT